MGRAPCCDKSKVKKGPWSQEEDIKLKEYIEKNGTGGNWIALPQKAGLKRCGKSCRLRWLNYLRPNIKHGAFSDDEDRIICTLFATIGSRWSIIAAQLPGRTDNDIKNYWNTKLKKKLLGISPSQRKTNQQTHHQQQQQQPQLFSGIPLGNMATSAALPIPSSHVLMFGGGHQQSCSPSELGFGGGDGGGAGFDNYIYGGLEDTQKVLHGGHGIGELAQVLQYGSYEDIKNLVSASSTSLQLDQDVPAVSANFSFIRTQDRDTYSYYMNV